jgi:hypothetical protein
MLLLASRLCKVDRSRRTPQMVQDKAMVARWQLLNPTERYFSLLERWWNMVDFEQDRFGLAASRMAEYLCTFLERHRPGSRANERDEKWQEAMLRLLGMKQVALMQLFGLLDITASDALPGEGWKIRHMVATPWGLSASRTHFQSFRYTTDSLLEHLLNPAGKNSTLDELEAEEELERHPFLLWASRVLPFFPSCRHYLGDPEAAEPFQGSVTLKVSLDKDTWRRIVMPWESSFEDLALFILGAFKFDDEHIYRFSYRDEYATLRTLDDPRCSDVDHDYADAVTLGEVGLFPGQVLEFRYDFGDDWRFEVLVEELDASATGAKPALLTEKGKAPRQYR